MDPIDCSHVQPRQASDPRAHRWGGSERPATIGPGGNHAGAHEAEWDEQWTGTQQVEWNPQHFPRPTAEEMEAQRQHYERNRRLNHGGMRGMCGACLGSKNCGYLSLNTYGILALFLGSIFLIIGGVINSIDCCGPTHPPFDASEVKAQCVDNYMDVGISGPNDGSSPHKTPCEDYYYAYIVFFVVGGLLVTSGLVLLSITMFCGEYCMKTREEWQTEEAAEQHRAQLQAEVCAAEMGQIRSKADRKMRRDLAKLADSEAREMRKWQAMTAMTGVDGRRPVEKRKGEASRSLFVYGQKYGREQEDSHAANGLRLAAGSLPDETRVPVESRAQAQSVPGGCLPYHPEHRTVVVRSTAALP